MFVMENTESKVIRVRDVDKVVVMKETIARYGPMRFRIFGKGNEKRVVWKASKMLLLSCS